LLQEIFYADFAYKTNSLAILLLGGIEAELSGQFAHHRLFVFAYRHKAVP
jgi:hypothetical protein